MMMLDWVGKVEPDGVKAFGISPAFLLTGLGVTGLDFMNKIGAGYPSLGGQSIKGVVEGNRDGDAGKITNKDGVQPW